MPRRFSVPLILITLFALIAAPVVASGYSDLRQGRAALDAGEYAGAAEFFESAARRLFWRADLWEQAGLAAYRAGDPAESLRLLETARQRAAMHPEGWDALGLSYWAIGAQDSALAAWRQGADLYPDHAPLHDHLAMAYHARADYSSEQEALAKLVSLWPDDAAAHYRRGLILAVSDPLRALPELMSAASLDAQFVPAVRALGAALALAELEQAASPRKVIVGRGLGLVNEWPLAAEVFRQAVEADERSAEAWAWLGEAKQHLGQDGRAELNRALELSPGSATVRGLRGLYWQRQGKDALALAEFDIAVRFEPDNPAWRAALGDAFARMGDLPPALAAYQRAVELAPQDPLYWRLLAAFCVQNNVYLKEVGFPAALKAAALAPQDALSRDVLGWVYLQMGESESARRALEKALDLDPGLASAHLHMAILLMQKGAWQDGRDHLLQARHLAGDDPIGQQAASLLAQYFP